MFKFLNPRSIGKAALDLATSAGSVAALCGLVFLENPEAAAALFAEFGPFAPVVAPLFFAGVRYLKDRVKHGPAKE